MFLLSKISKWFIGEYLEKTPDYFEQARIRVTFNLTLISFFLLLPTLIPIINKKLYFDFAATILSLAGMGAVPFILKFTHDVKKSAFIVSISIFIGISLSILFESENLAFSNMFFCTAQIVFTFFALGKKLGIFFSVAFSLVWLYYFKFLLYDNLHTESAYETDKLIIFAIVVVIGITMSCYTLIMFINSQNFGERKIKEKSSDLEEVNKQLDTFTHSVSHDLRAPLRTIKGFSVILENDFKENLGTEGLDLLNRIKGGEEKMSKLIEDLLAFSRLGRHELNITEINTVELVQNVVADIQKLLSNPNTKIIINKLPSVQADNALLRQVFTNLISNAVKYSSKVEKPIIEIGAETNNVEVIFSIKDNGAGFDMLYYDKLFKVFQRLHDESEFEGTGIGLSIVNNIISRHKGKVWAEGKVNEGATFYFSLPKLKVPIKV